MRELYRVGRRVHAARSFVASASVSPGWLPPRPCRPIMGLNSGVDAAPSPILPMDRREFLRATVSGTTGMLMAERLAIAAASHADSEAPVPLGRTVKATRLGFGTGMAGGGRQSNQTRLGPEKLERLLQYAYDQGVRLFDMADLYGTHRYVARALRGKPRDSYTLVTKIWLHPGGLPEPRAARR